MNNVIIQNIRKTYEKGSVLAVDNVSMEINSGELFGLIGPDGAGKTSLFRMLTTLLLPDSGKASVCGLDVVKDMWKIRNIVGYMPGKFSLYQDLSIWENLNFFATVFKTTVEKNYELIKDIYVQIEPYKNRPAGKLSGGMKQKLALCCALIHEPKVLFLDEPTTGVDPVSRREFWDMLDGLKKKGITIIVSTPYMDEASRCDRIALMQKGKIMDLAHLDEIIRKNQRPLYAIHSEKRFQLLQDLRAYEDTISCFAFGENHHLSLKSGYEKETELRTYLESLNYQDIELQRITPNIEDIFIQLMQENHAA